MIVAVIGLGTFGSKTAISLYEKGAEVIGIDISEKLVDRIKDRVTHGLKTSGYLLSRASCAQHHRT